MNFCGYRISKLNFNYLKKAILEEALFLQVLNAVTATPEAGLCHLDIKLENLLVAKDYSLRLCDYGFSRPTEKNL